MRYFPVTSFLCNLSDLHVYIYIVCCAVIKADWPKYLRYVSFDVLRNNIFLVFFI